MSSAPKKGRPRKNLDYRVQARQTSALARRKANLNIYLQLQVSTDAKLNPITAQDTAAKIKACERDIKGLEAKLSGSVLS